MSEKPKSFEEFYYSPNAQTFDIDLVEDYAESHDGDFEPYRGNMFCPECMKAELTFYRKTSKKRAYLKRIPSTVHMEGCSYNYDYASHKTVKKYIEALTPDEVQDKLNAIMNLLFRKKAKKAEDNNINEGSEHKQVNPMLILDSAKDTNVLKALRRKKLNTWIDESDGEELCVFYGDVKLKVVEKIESNENPEKSYTYNLLEIYTLNKKGEWKRRTGIYRGSIKDLIDENDIYHIVIIGNLEFKYKPWSIKLASRNALRYRKV